MTIPIIDMRSRPALLGEFYGGIPNTPGYETAKWLNRRTGSKQDDHFTRSYTLQGYLDEIQESGISQAVLVGRDTPGLTISNDQIHQLTRESNRLIGLASVDPQRHGTTASLQEIERAVGILGLKAVNLEPGFGLPPLLPDAPIFDPIYEYCQHLNVPVCLMSGPTTPDLDYNDPSAVARVAKRYPHLSIICYHGFYPRVEEIIGVAFRYENVHLIPDMYLFAPGSQVYREAANSILREQLLFATSYPFRAMAQTVDDFINLGWREEVLEFLLHKNARRLLHL